MRTLSLLVTAGLLQFAPTTSCLRADEVLMQNGDRYLGKVLSVSADTVVLSSEMLGKINVPRQKVASLTFGTNLVAAPVASRTAPSGATNHPVVTATSTSTNTNTDVLAALRRLGANTNFVAQVREQMLAGNLQAAGKYDQMVNDLMSGKLNLNDLRREAQSSAKQLQDLKRDLDPEAGELLDGYLQILNGFLKEADTDSIESPQPERRR